MRRSIRLPRWSAIRFISPRQTACTSSRQSRDHLRGILTRLCLKSQELYLEEVSTVRGSGWVVDQHAIFAIDFKIRAVSPTRYRVVVLML